MKRSLSIVFCLFLAMSAAPSLLRAQDVASVTGVVTDTSDAVVVGAGVALVNTTTNASYHTKTNSLGSYIIVNVPPGPGYKLTFTQGGFRPEVVTDIYLAVASTRTQNAKLHAGDVSQTIEVSAANEEVTLDTTDATIGNNIDIKLLNDLPVQVRDTPGALLQLLQPGVAAGSVTGARTDQTDVTVDGLDVNDISTGQAFLMVANAPVDAVEEFRGTVAGELASSGPGSGGQFQMVTKSGSNAWHGNLNEYHRDTSTAANYWFDDNVGVPLAHYVRNQFGGSVGGPIKKDKAFFFFDFFDLRRATSVAEETTVPLTSYSNGNIQYILATPSSGSSTCSYTSRQNTTPLCIGSLTPAQVKSLDPLGIGFSPVLESFFQSRFPAPNDLTGGDGINTGGYRFNAPDPEDETNYVAKVDYTLTPTMKLSGKVGINRMNEVEFPQILPSDPILANPLIDRSYDYVVSHSWTIGANRLNQFYYGDTIEKFDFPATYAPTGTTVLTLGDYVGFLGDPYPTQQTQKRRIPIPVVRDDFSWQVGSHSLGFGGSFKFIKTESKQILDFNFVGLGLGPALTGLSACQRPGGGTGCTPNSYAPIRGGSTAPSLYDNAFALGLGHVASVQTNYNYNAGGMAFPNGTGHLRRYRYYQTDLYLNDTWKITKSLTMTYGLRYQFYTVPYEVAGAESIQNWGFDQYFGVRAAQSAAGQSGDGSVPFITYSLGGKGNKAVPLYTPSYKDLAPRVAFAYNVPQFPKMVLNAGAGIVFDRTVTNALNFVQDQSSYLFQNTVSNSFGSSSAQAALIGDPRIGTNFSFPGNTAPTITKPYTPYVSGGTPYGLGEYTFNSIIDPNLKDPYSISMNAGIQQQIPGNFVLKVNYVERLGRRLLAQADASQLIDFPDATSGQELSTAFGNITKEMRAGQVNATPQPWFENQIGPGWTQILYSFGPLEGLIANGDFADFIQDLAYYGPILNSDVGMASQFSENTFYTNKGFSSYAGLLATLQKNLSHGLQFDVNYTYSHSMDNTSLIADVLASNIGAGFICDATRPRECRANSDFDETHVINGDFTYALPVGTGKMLLGAAPRWEDEIVGGWTISGIPSWHSGVAFSATSNAYVAGFANNAPAIFNGNHAAIKANRHKNSDGSVNLFAGDGSAANAAFSGPVGLNIGSRNNLRGPSAFGMDAGVAKAFPLVTDRISMKFRADAFNVFNHPTFALPASDITDELGTPFGQINSQANAPRVLQFALRVEF
jgi:hypothetical protein